MKKFDKRKKFLHDTISPWIVCAPLNMFFLAFAATVILNDGLKGFCEPESRNLLLFSCFIYTVFFFRLDLNISFLQSKCNISFGFIPTRKVDYDNIKAICIMEQERSKLYFFVRNLNKKKRTTKFYNFFALNCDIFAEGDNLGILRYKDEYKTGIELKMQREYPNKLLFNWIYRVEIIEELLLHVGCPIYMSKNVYSDLEEDFVSLSKKLNLEIRETEKCVFLSARKTLSQE